MVATTTNHQRHDHSHHQRAQDLVIRPLLGLGSVALVAVALLSLGTDRAVAALAFTAVVVLVGRLGMVTAGVSAVASFLALNYWFIPITGTFTFESLEDLMPLIAFGVAGIASDTVATRWHALRARVTFNEREAAEARIEAAVNEARARFLGAMTHNLRTPLASVTSAATTLRGPATDANPTARAALVDTIVQQTDRLDRLVTKVLAITSVHAGAAHPELEPVDVSELARGALHHVRLLTAGRPVELRALDDVEADVDPQMIELVLVNLLENALRYSPPATAISVVTGRAPDDADACEIRVIDHGIGVPATERERVFEEFVRLDPSVDSSGSGLGLAIARAFVAAHDGTLAIEETPRGGATFVVTLPRARRNP